MKTYVDLNNGVIATDHLRNLLVNTIFMEFQRGDDTPQIVLNCSPNRCVLPLEKYLSGQYSQCDLVPDSDHDRLVIPVEVRAVIIGVPS